MVKLVTLPIYNRNTCIVADLIEALKQMPPNSPVFTEGCDCFGNSISVELEDNGDVLIHRNN